MLQPIRIAAGIIIPTSLTEAAGPPSGPVTRSSRARRRR